MQELLRSNKIKYLIISNFIIVAVFGININTYYKAISVIALFSYSVFTIFDRKKIKYNYYFKWFLLINTLLLLGIVVSVNRNNSLSYFSSSVLRMLMMLALFQLVEPESNYHAFFNILKTVSFAAVLYAVINEFNTFHYNGMGDTYGNKIAFSYITIFAFMITIYLYFEYREWHDLILSILFYVASLLTSGRKAMIIPLVFLVVFLLIKKRNEPKKIFQIILGISFIFVIVVLLSFKIDLLYNILGYRVETFFISIFGGNIVDESTSIRMSMINEGIRFFKERPILGYGADSYRLISSFDMYSHNNYIETVINGGLSLLIPYYSLHVIAIFKNARKDLNNFNIFAISFYLVLMIFDFGTITFFVYQINMLMMLLAIEKHEFINLTSLIRRSR